MLHAYKKHQEFRQIFILTNTYFRARCSLTGNTNLVRKDEKTLVFGEFDDVFDVVSGEDLAGRVAGIDDANSAGIAIAASFADRAF